MIMAKKTMMLLLSQSGDIFLGHQSVCLGVVLTRGLHSVKGLFSIFEMKSVFIFPNLTRKGSYVNERRKQSI